MNDDRARSIVRNAGGDELVERLAHLDRVRAERRPESDAPLAKVPVGTEVDADVIFAGGGLSLLIAVSLAARGLRVIVVDRARAGVTHREWNASAPELEALVRGGITTRAELDALVVARYARGVCQFHGGPAYAVTGVLDHAVDAGRLLTHARARAEATGQVRFLDAHSVVGLGTGPDAVRVRARSRDGAEVDLVGRILVDARGAASPYARGDLVCPTVGGVLSGLVEGDATDAIDPATGEILITNEPHDHGRQHLWEAFPGRAGAHTVYLFYYARAGEEGSLAALYARFFETLPRYKRGEAKLLRPTFGYIPAWTRTGPAPRPPAPRVVLVGDAASRHSPLTMCGFGAMLRSFDAAAAAIESAIARGDSPTTDRGALAHDAPIHALTGGLALLMARPPRDPDALNGLLDAAFGTLASLGNDTYAALLRDETTPAGFTRFLRTMSGRRPSVYRDVMRSIPPMALARWGWRMAREVMAHGA